MKTRGNPSGPEISKDLAKGRIYGRNGASGPADIETKNACKPEESIYDLGKAKLSAGAPVMMLDPQDITLSGDVSGKFRKAAKTPF